MTETTVQALRDAAEREREATRICMEVAGDTDVLDIGVQCVKIAAGRKDNASLFTGAAERIEALTRERDEARAQLERTVQIGMRRTQEKLAAERQIAAVWAADAAIAGGFYGHHKGVTVRLRDVLDAPASPSAVGAK